jgi:hypothetical protein
MLGTHLKRLVEAHGVAKVNTLLAESIKSGRISKHQVSLRQIAEAFLGHQWDVQLKRHQARLLEATEAVDASAFSNITGQLLINEIKDRYKRADFIGDQLAEVVPITNGNLQTQKTPWLGAIVDAPDVVGQGMPYPKTSFGEQYITYPAPAKRGYICQVTFEMIFSDLTSQALEAAGAVGERLGIDREERILNVVLGLTNNHVWNGTAYDTYQTTTPWINKLSSIVLTNWTHINTVEQLFAKMTDPVSGKPIQVNVSGLLVMPAKRYTAKRIVNATETRSGDTDETTSNQTLAPNPLDGSYPILSSKYAYALNVASGVSEANTNDTWFMGDFKKAFVYREVFPLKTEQAPPQNPMEFEQDIVHAVRASEFGVAAVRDPRYAAKIINS